MDILGGGGGVFTKLDCFGGLFYIFLYVLGSFLKVNVQNGNLFGRAEVKKRYD